MCCYETSGRPQEVDMDLGTSEQIDRTRNASSCVPRPTALPRRRGPAPRRDEGGAVHAAEVRELARGAGARHALGAPRAKLEHLRARGAVQKLVSSFGAINTSFCTMTRIFSVTGSYKPLQMAKRGHACRFDQVRCIPFLRHHRPRYVRSPVWALWTNYRRLSLRYCGPILIHSDGGRRCSR